MKKEKKTVNVEINSKGSEMQKAAHVKLRTKEILDQV